MVELVDTQDLGSCALWCEGSSPFSGTAARSVIVARADRPVQLMGQVPLKDHRSVKQLGGPLDAKASFYLWGFV